MVQFGDRQGRRWRTKKRVNQWAGRYRDRTVGLIVSCLLFLDLLMARILRLDGKKRERERDNWYLRASDARSASSKRPAWNKRSQKGDRVSEYDTKIGEHKKQKNKEQRMQSRFPTRLVLGYSTTQRNKKETTSKKKKTDLAGCRSMTSMCSRY